MSRPRPPTLRGSSKFTESKDPFKGSFSTLPDDHAHRWTSFSSAYRRFDKKAWAPDGTGNLQKPCTITVHDYGHDFGYQINGQPHDQVQDPEKKVRNVAELKQAFPATFFDSKPGFVRWIDMEGMQGEVVQFLMHVLDCERQYTFNNIVDLKQRPMGILLDSDADEAPDLIKFLFVSKVPRLTVEAERQFDDGSATLYAVNSTDGSQDKGSDDEEEDRPRDRAATFIPEVDAVEFEQITYLLRIDDKNGGGTLITFQEGKEGDVFGQVRDVLAESDNRSRIRSRGVSFLFLQLILASTESAVNISAFMSMAVDQLSAALDNAPNDLALIGHARHIDAECNVLHRLMSPFADALTQMTSGDFPPQLMGRSRAAWSSVKFQLHRLVENVVGIQDRAKSLVDEYRDRQSKRQEEAQERIEKSQGVMSLVLSIFSPLAFISGIYGMNFVKSDGSPGIPELSWGWSPSDPADPMSAPERTSSVTGYGYFWLLTMGIVLLTVSGYMLLGLLHTPNQIYRMMKKFFKKRCCKPKTANATPEARPPHRAHTKSVMAPPSLEEDSDAVPMRALNDESEVASPRSPQTIENIDEHKPS